MATQTQGIPTKPKPKVLVLGGSTQARALVTAIADRYCITLSLAGTTVAPSTAFPNSVTVRRGGFGGVDGLASALRNGHYVACIDATHPYAATMHANAVAACAQTKTPHLRIDRPAWQAPAGAMWIPVQDGAKAVAHVLAQGWRRVFVTTGRVHLDPWRGLGDRVTVIVRSIDPADLTGIDRVEAITQRGPFSIAAEMAILRHCDALVTRNSGGNDAKIQAAVATNTPILVWERPPAPAWVSVPDVPAALAWLAQQV